MHFFIVVEWIRWVSDDYHKVPKFSDTSFASCNSPIIQTKRPYLKEFCQKHANGIASSEDPDLIWVCTVVPKFRIITVLKDRFNNFSINTHTDCTHKNCLIETILLRTQNICSAHVYEKISKSIHYH